MTQRIAVRGAHLPTASDPHRMPRCDIPLHGASQARIKVRLPGSHQPNNFNNRRFGMHHGHTLEVDVNGSATYEGHCVKLHSEWRIRRTGYKRLLEMIGALDPQWSITSAPIN
ncbi:hypothetical protein [Pseudomonas gregormendelii]|uniref:hypothetical protein n=1 Tax=Pseudomonas gregormendelii TaxID=1628277 RepID=UPI00301329D8